MNESTMEKIKKSALTLFASHGYEGTTMSQIARGVGIKKPSLYAHFSGKEELFLSIFQDILRDYQCHMERVYSSVENKSPQNQLFSLFEQYILYFLHKKEYASFFNRILLFPPESLKEALFVQLASLEESFDKKTLLLINQGKQEGVIKDSPSDKIIITFKCLRGGLLILMGIAPQLDKKQIEASWRVFWEGVKNN